MRRDGLTCVSISAYSMGHFKNGLCAAMWFFYLLWYLKNVVELDAKTAGYCMLAGQICDGIATPVVGMLSDKYETRIGKRMPYYIMGTLLVTPAFLGIFSFPSFIQKDTVSETMKHLYYIACAGVFNVGWSSVQISHLSVVNQLSMSN